MATMTDEEIASTIADLPVNEGDRKQIAQNFAAAFEINEAGDFDGEGFVVRCLGLAS